MCQGVPHERQSPQDHVGSHEGADGPHQDSPNERPLHEAKFERGDQEFDHRLSRAESVSVTPAKAGIQAVPRCWTPAFAGVTVATSGVVACFMGLTWSVVRRAPS